MVINTRKTLDKRGGLALRNYTYGGSDEKNARVPLTSGGILRTATLLFSLAEEYMFLFTSDRVHVYNMSTETIGTITLNISSSIKFDEIFADSFYSVVDGGTMVVTSDSTPPLALQRVGLNNFVLSAITFTSPPIKTASTAEEVQINEANKTKKVKYVSPIAFSEVSGKSKFYLSTTVVPIPETVKQELTGANRYQIKAPDTVLVSDTYTEEQLAEFLVSELKISVDKSRVLQYDIIPRKEKLAWQTIPNRSDFDPAWVPSVNPQKPYGLDAKTFNPDPQAIDPTFKIEDSTLERFQKMPMIPLTKQNVETYIKPPYANRSPFFATQAPPTPRPTANGFLNNTQKNLPDGVKPYTAYDAVSSNGAILPRNDLVELDLSIDKISTVNGVAGQRLVFATASYDYQFAIPTIIHPSKSNPFALYDTEDENATYTDLFRLHTFLTVKVMLSIEMSFQFKEGNLVIALLSIFDNLPDDAGVNDYADIKPPICSFTLDDTKDATFVGNQGGGNSYSSPMDIANEGDTSKFISSHGVPATGWFLEGNSYDGTNRSTVDDIRDGGNYSRFTSAPRICVRSNVILESISQEVKNTFERFANANLLPQSLPLSESIPTTSETRNSNREKKALEVALNSFSYLSSGDNGLLYQDIQLPYDGVFRITNFDSTVEGRGYFIENPTPDITDALRDLKEKNNSHPEEGDDKDLEAMFGNQIKGNRLSAFVKNSISVTTVNRIAWNPRDGYPRVCAFYQARLFLASTRTQGAYLWASRVGDYYNYDNGSGRDNEGFDFVIDSDSFGAIQHLAVGTSLVILTVYQEYYVRTDEQAPITPATMNVMRVSSYGSTQARPTFIDGAVVFIGRNSHCFVSLKKNENGYSMSATKLNIPIPTSNKVPKNIIKMEIIRPKISTETEKIFALTDEGDIFCFNYEGAGGVSGWTNMETNGKFLGICGVNNSLMTIVQRPEEAYKIIYKDNKITTSTTPLYDDYLKLILINTISPFDFIYRTGDFGTETTSIAYSLERLMPEDGRNLDFRIPVPSAYLGTNESITESKVRLNSTPCLLSPVFEVVNGGKQQLNLKSSSYWGYLYETKVVLHPLYRNYGAFDTFDKIIKLSVCYVGVEASGIIDVHVDGKKCCSLYSEEERTMNIAEARVDTGVRSGPLFSELTKRTVVSLTQTDVGSFSLLYVSVDGAI